MKGRPRASYRTVQALGVLMDLIYSIFVWLSLWNQSECFFDKKQDFLSVFLMKLTHIQVLILRSFFVCFFKAGSVLSFNILHVQIFIQQNILGANDTFVKMVKSAGGGWQRFSKLPAGKELNTKHHKKMERLTYKI